MLRKILSQVSTATLAELVSSDNRRSQVQTPGSGRVFPVSFIPFSLNLNLSAAPQLPIIDDVQ